MLGFFSLVVVCYYYYYYYYYYYGFLVFSRSVPILYCVFFVPALIAFRFISFMAPTYHNVR